MISFKCLSCIFIIFGHSYVKHAYHLTRDGGKTVNNFLNFPSNYNMYLDGYSNITYSKLAGDIPRYFRVMKSRQIDVLSIDLGTNDLCGISNTDSVVVENAMQFLDLL